MNDDQLLIVCPHCKKSFPPSQAFSHQLKVAEREMKDKIRKEVEDKTNTELTALKKQLEEKDEKMGEFRKREMKLLDDKRKLEDREKELTLEVKRKLDEGRKTIEESERKRAFEEYGLEIKAKEKTIEDLKKSLDEARRRASVGSQQLQGEVLELDLEEQLRKQYPNDEIKEIKKGAEGGDLLQIVTDSRGKKAGVILWETKRTKTWSKSWLPKLREDARRDGASVCVLVSDILPPEIESFGMMERVWITTRSFAIPVSIVLRGAMLKISSERIAIEHKDEKMEFLFKYLTSEKFIHRFEAQVENIIGLKGSLDTERRSMKRIWKQREVQIERLIDNLANMYGEFQGIVGQTSLPPIKNLELGSGLEPDDEEV